MRMKVVALIVLLLFVNVWSYGPATHMAQADHYIELCESHHMSGLVHDPVLLRSYHWVFRLGSIWPDIARILVKMDDVTVDEDSRDPHNRHFNTYLLNKAIDEYPTNAWKVPFAAGCLMHNSGDLVAQDILVPHLAVRGYLGPMDILIGYDDDKPDGEDEDFIEAGLDAVHGDWGLYVGLVDEFVVNSTGRHLLQDIVSYYLAEYNEYFHMGFDEDFAKLEGVLRGLPCSGGWMARKACETMVDIVRRLVKSDNVGEIRSVFSGGSDVLSVAGISINWKEIDRVFSGPVHSRKWWNVYFDEGYDLLSPSIMLTFAPGQGYFDDFPNWSATALQSGAYISLNHYLPGILEAEDGVFLLDLQWVDVATGKSVRSIPKLNPPNSVRLTASVFLAPGRSTSTQFVYLRVREDSEKKESLGMIAVNISQYDCFDIGHFAPHVVSFDFNPVSSIQKDNVKGFIAELSHTPNSKPFFTTDWDIYRTISELDFTKPVFQKYGTYKSTLLYSLRVN